MSYVTQDTIWLSDDINQDLKNLVARFYELADSNIPDSGPRMADEVFSADALLISPNGKFQGFEEISKSRADAWSKVKTRKHEIAQAFSGTDTTQNLILLGTVQMTLIDGNVVDASFSCHIKLKPHRAEEPKPRISFMEVYLGTVSEPRPPVLH